MQTLFSSTLKKSHVWLQFIGLKSESNTDSLQNIETHDRPVHWSYWLKEIQYKGHDGLKDQQMVAMYRRDVKVIDQLHRSISTHL